MPEVSLEAGRGGDVWRTGFHRCPFSKRFANVAQNANVARN